MIGTRVFENRSLQTKVAESHGFVIGRACARWTLAVIYLTAGIFHVWKPETFLLITPDWVPFPKQVIFITGICEITGAFALLTHRLRYAAGIAFALYAICVYPANIKHAFYGVPLDHAQLTWWYHAPRLAFQPVLVWWALFVGEVTIWPFNKGHSLERRDIDHVPNEIQKIDPDVKNPSITASRDEGTLLANKH
jgi:uncharacterized membrane protein